MAVQITHVRFGSTDKTESSITNYRWKNPSSGKIDESNKAAMVEWMDDQGGEAYVGSGDQRVQVGVVHPDSGKPYLRTYADGKWTNNLVNLPEF